MSDGYLISVGVKADFSDLKAQQKSAEEAVRQATANMEAAYAQLGKAAELGNVQAAEALKTYEVELDQAKAKAASLATAIAELSAAEQAETSSLQSNITARMAASSELRLLEGNLQASARAAGAFLSTLPGIGAAMQAAFPVAGAAALLAIIVQAGGALAKFGEDAAELSRKLDTNWLAGAIGQMSGLKDLVQQTDELLLGVAKDTDRSNQKALADRVEQIRMTQGNAAAAREEAAQIRTRNRAVQEAIDIQKGAVSDAQTKVSDSIDLSSASENGLSQQQDALEASQELEQSKGNLTKLLKEQEEIQARIVALDDEASRSQKKEDEEKARKGLAAENKANEERMRADELAYNQLRISHNLTLQEEAKFWQERLDGFGEKTAQYAAITAKLAEIYTKSAEDTHRAIEAYKKEQKKLTEEEYPASEGIAKALEGLNEDLTRTGERWASYNAEVARGIEIQIENSAKLAEARIAFELATGAITQQAAAHQLAAIHAKEYADRLAELRAELKKIQEDQALTPEQKATKSQGIQNQITQVQGQSDVSKVADSTKQASQFEKPWLKSFDEIGRQWMRVQDQILKGQISIGRGVQQMASSMLLDVVHSYEQMIAAAIRRKVMDVAAHVEGEATKTGATAAGAATRGTIETAETLKSVFHHAVSAAAGAYSALAGIPIVGPELGAIAAAATFAGVMSLAAFEKGGIVPGSIGSAVPIVAHAGERVLTTQQTSTFERMVNGGGNNPTSGTTNHFGNNTFNGVADAKTFQRMLNKHERSVAASAKKALRNGRF